MVEYERNEGQAIWDNRQRFSEAVYKYNRKFDEALANFRLDNKVEDAKRCYILLDSLFMVMENFIEDGDDDEEKDRKDKIREKLEDIEERIDKQNKLEEVRGKRITDREFINKMKEVYKLLLKSQDDMALRMPQEKGVESLDDLI